LISLILTFTLGLQATLNDSVREAAALFKQAESFVGRSKAKKMFMLRNGGKTWVPMQKDTDHLNPEGMWSENTSQVAYVYVRDGRTLLVTLTNGSMSGDYLTTTALVYRPDGSLAKCEQTYWAFAPTEGSAVREWVFDSVGRQLLATTKCTNIAEKKLMVGEEAKSFIEGASPFLPEPAQYRTVQGLPFTNLISPTPVVPHESKLHKPRALAGKYELVVTATERDFIESGGNTIPYYRFSGSNKWEMKIIVNRMSGTYTRRGNTLTMVKTTLNGKKPTGDARKPTRVEVLDDGRAIDMGGQVFRKVD
jgi:hypothetical protein